MRNKHDERRKHVSVVHPGEEEQQREKRHVHARVDGVYADRGRRVRLLLAVVGGAAFCTAFLDETAALQRYEREEDDGEPVGHAERLGGTVAYYEPHEAVYGDAEEIPGEAIRNERRLAPGKYDRES